MTDYLREQLASKLDDVNEQLDRHVGDSMFNQGYEHALEECARLLDTVRCDNCVHYVAGGKTWGTCEKLSFFDDDDPVVHHPNADHYCAAFKPKGDE